MQLNAKEVRPLNTFSFPVACHALAVSPDGLKILAAGVYKPAIKLFDLKAGIMKFERHIASDPVKILSLEDDGEKFAVLRSDKAVEFHTKGGHHEMVKTPRQPKDMLHNTVIAELYLGCADEIYRFNLEQGRFLRSIPVPATRMAWSSTHGLLGAAYKDSLVFIDSRSRSEVFSNRHESELFAIAQDKSGLRYAVGTEDGEVCEYDFRSSAPLRKHVLDSPIQKLEFSDKSLVAATGTQIYSLGGSSASLDVGFKIYDFAVRGGALFVGGEQADVETFICEDIGSIPSWAI